MVTRSPGARRRGFLTTPAKYVTYIRESTNHHLEILTIRLICVLWPWPLTPWPWNWSTGCSCPGDPGHEDSRWGTGQTDGQTDRQTDGQHRYIMGPPSRKDGPIINIQLLNSNSHNWHRKTWLSAPYTSKNTNSSLREMLFTIILLFV